MPLKITTLSENTAGMVNYLAEWGLSILVETGDTTVLLDTGQGISVCRNVDVLGIDLGKVDKIVLSHGHYDHTGGLREVLGKMKKGVDVIAHPDIWQPKYARRPGHPDRYIGMPFQREELESLGARFKLTAEPVRVGRSIMTTGEVPMVTEFEKIAQALMVKENGGFQPDPIRDDQALVIKTEHGLVVILGCAHRGAINTLYHARRITGVDQVYMVLGGCHLMDSTQEQVWLTIAALKELGVQRLGLSHCTGLPAACLIRQEFGENFFFNNTGTVVEVP